MSDRSKIEWTEATWNPVTGCTPISEACTNCYAKRMARRLAGRCGYPEGDGFAVTVHEDKFDEPGKWKKPRRIFVCSMGDLFHEDVHGRAINAVWMEMFNHPRHTYILLTKRPDRMLQWTQMAARAKQWPIEDIWPPHIWLGVTAENQQRANERIPILLDIPAAVHWVSVEPMLGPVDLSSVVLNDGDSLGAGLYSQGLGVGLDWVVCGAETGPGKRPMDWQWAFDLKEQCRAAGVPFFFKKQSNGGHQLGGQTYEQYPEVQG